MAAAIVTQAGLLVVSQIDGTARVTQSGLLVITDFPTVLATGIYAEVGAGSTLTYHAVQHYSFTGSKGSYSEAGVSSGQMRSRTMVLSTGSYSESGISGTLFRFRGIIGGTGNYSVGSGSDADLVSFRNFIGALGVCSEFSTLGVTMTVGTVGNYYEIPLLWIYGSSGSSATVRTTYHFTGEYGSYSESNAGATPYVNILPVEYSVSASSHVVVKTGLVYETTQSTYLYASASSHFRLTGRNAQSILLSPQSFAVRASSKIKVAPGSSLTASRILSVSVASKFKFAGTLGILANRAWSLGASNRLKVSSSPGFSAEKLSLASVSSRLKLKASSGPAGVRDAAAHVGSGIAFRPNATGGRDIYVHAETSMGFEPELGNSAGVHYPGSASSFILGSSCFSPGSVPFGASNRLILRSYAAASLYGSSDLSGSSTSVLLSGLSTDGFPFSLIETGNGVMLMANGIDPMVRWDCLTSDANYAGVASPPGTLTMAGSGNGLILGSRWAYCRYIDKFGNKSNLSPVCGPILMGRSMWISVIRAASNGVLICTSLAHGLMTGGVISIFGAEELSVTGQFTIVVIDQNSFSLAGISRAHGVQTSTPSYWAQGASQVVYSNVPVPTDPKIATREILRNLDGNAQTFYVDISTDDTTSTTLSSSRLDDSLSAQTPVPLAYESEMPEASRFDLPPSHKRVLEYHLGRVFAAVDCPYDLGNAIVSAGSSIVQGIGTSWISTFADRAFYCDGAQKIHHVTRVVNGQFLVLDQPYQGSSNKFAGYSIRPSDTESRLVYYCCDMDTEVLTGSGWKNCNELVMEDQILALDTNTKSIEWTPLLAINKFPFSGNLHHWTNSTFDAMTTEDHRWMVSGSGISRGRLSDCSQDPDFHFQSTVEIGDLYNKKLITSGGSPCDIKWQLYEDEFVELVGWYITEGTQQAQGNTGVIIYQSLKHNPDYVERIRKLVLFYSSLGCTATEGKHQDMGHGPIVFFYFGKGIGDRLRDACPGKELTPDFLVDLTATQLSLLFDTLMNGDGHRHSGRDEGQTCDIFAQKSVVTTDAFQMLCSMLGRRSRKRLRTGSVCHETTAYRDGLGFTMTKTLVKEQVEYHGHVWCPTTKHGTWMARRNGCTFWTGNSEPDLPEAWPSWNAFAVPDHGDEITGLMVFKSYLYIIERRHISQFTFKGVPGRDGFIFLKSHRGCISNRCYSIVEDAVYMLDESGVHRFDGDSSTHISAKINNIFNDPTYPYTLDWGSSNVSHWHSVQDPAEENVRWFVDFVGKPRLTHALCYDYRRDRWWIEQYPEAIVSSCTATIGHRRVLAGTTARRVVVLGEGTLDGISGSVYGSLRGTIESSTNTTVTVVANQPPIPTSLAGVSLTITSGVAKGKSNIVVANLSDVTLEFLEQWEVVPQPGDTFMIGAVNWKWRNGWLPYVDQEEDYSRDLAAVFKPTSSDASFDLQLWFDYADEPQKWTIPRSTDGVSTINGSPDINVSTDRARGYAFQRMQSRREQYGLSNYFVSLGASGSQGTEATRVFEFIVNGVYSQARK